MDLNLGKCCGSRSSKKESWRSVLLLAYQSLGVVYGDLGDNFTPLNHHTRRSFFSHLNKHHEPLDNLPKPVFKSNISMRDVLRRKQVPKEDIVVPQRQSLEGQIPRRNANLSQMLKELKQGVKFSARAEKEVHEEKQFVTQRRKFGFIHITLPLQKQSKKKSSL